MRMATANSGGPALFPVQEGRQYLENLGFWHREAAVQDVNFRCIQETDALAEGKAKVFVVAQFKGVEHPLKVDCPKELRALTGVSVDTLREYVDAPELLGRLITHSVSKRADTGIRFSGVQDMVMDMQLADGRAWVDPLYVFDAAVNELGEGTELEDISVAKRHLTVRFVGEHALEPPKRVGDIVRSGTIIQMNGRLAVGGYAYRLICANGAQRRFDYLEPIRNAADLEMSLRNIIQVSHHQARHLTEALISLDERPFSGNREQIVLRLSRQVRLPRSFTSRVLGQLPTLGADATLYDLANLMTAEARTLRSPEMVQTRLGDVITVLAPEHARCNNCGATLENGGTAHVTSD